MKHQFHSLLLEVDHAIDHENRLMKVLNGIKGMAIDTNRLTKYVIIAYTSTHTGLSKRFPIWLSEYQKRSTQWADR